MSLTALVAYNTRSEGALALSSSLMIPFIARDSVRMWGGPGHTLINWGCGDLPIPLPRTSIINEPRAVTTCIDKRYFFRLPGPFPRPPSTEKYNEAQEWLREGKTVLARTIVEGYDGAGLVVVRNVCDLPQARLYTQFIESDSEWRVHIFQGVVIVQQQRVKRRDYRGPDSPIRVSSNGYGFNVENVPAPVAEAGLLCFRDFELDFAALDIIYQSRTGKAYVLEINSAPELSHYCVQKYTEEFRRSCYGVQNSTR